RRPRRLDDDGSAVVRQEHRQHHQDLHAGHRMTAAITPDPQAVRPGLSGGVDPSPPRGRRVGGSGTTFLRVGTATLWLAVIVLLPLAAIAWQAAGGGWQAFRLAVTAHAAVEAFRVALVVPVVVTVLDVLFGLATAWVLVRDNFAGKGLIDALIDLPFALPTIVTSLVMLA